MPSATCNFRLDPNTPDEYVCAVCGGRWKDIRRCGRTPPLPCVGDVSEAWKRFDARLPMPRSIARHLAAWRDAGFPERADFDGAMAWIRSTLCEHRSLGGFCRKLGCGKDKDTNVHCSWLYRMATAKCGAGLFLTKQQEAKE